MRKIKRIAFNNGTYGYVESEIEGIEVDIEIKGAEQEGETEIVVTDEVADKLFENADKYELESDGKHGRLVEKAKARRKKRD